jgi:hypothetical protein
VGGAAEEPPHFAFAFAVACSSTFNPHKKEFTMPEQACVYIMASSFQKL